MCAYFFVCISVCVCVCVCVMAARTFACVGVSECERARVYGGRSHTLHTCVWVRKSDCERERYLRAIETERERARTRVTERERERERERSASTGERAR